MKNNDQMDIKLVWEGPFKFDSLNPEPLPGLYLWVVAGTSPSFDFTLSYVGESGDVRIRLRDEIAQLLGGRSWLWDIKKLRSSDLGVGVYQPDKKADEFFGRKKFLGQLSQNLNMAIANLEEYSFFCATNDRNLKDSKIRKATESALIQNAEIDNLFIGYEENLEKEKCIQNAKLSRQGPNIRVKSTFESGIRIKGVTQENWVKGATVPY